MVEPKKSIAREAAIKLIAEHDLMKLSAEERAHELFYLCLDDYCDEAALWKSLPESVRIEIEAQETKKIKDPNHNRFDQALLPPLMFNYRYATNAYLLKSIQEYGHKCEEVIGKFKPGLSCPCCGLETKDEKGAWSICWVCWWTDDWYDNADIDEWRDNADINEPILTGLLLARVNFLNHGISKPERTDLIEIQYPAEQFIVGRKFVIDEEVGILYEADTSWKVPLK